jgi:hypothetical protein
MQKRKGDWVWILGRAIVIVWMVVNEMAAINILIDFHGTPKFIPTPRFV